MFSTLARRAAVLLVPFAFLVVLPQGAAHADRYVYPCAGYVVQWHNGVGTMYWYDDNGNYGELGTYGGINTDLLCNGQMTVA